MTMFGLILLIVACLLIPIAIYRDIKNAPYFDEDEFLEEYNINEKENKNKK